MDVDKLINSINIVDFISQYVDLKQIGEEWWGLSCFKKEKTPSFSVRPNPPVFYDFSSGKGGNVITFVSEYYGISFNKAVEFLQDYLGEDTQSKNNSLISSQVCKRFTKNKRDSAKVEHKTLNKDIMEHYTYDTKDLLLWIKEGISEETLKDFDVRYDKFSNRIVYPIRNLNGDIINIGGRTLDKNYKEKKLRKYTYFYQWGQLDIIYGLFENLNDIKNKGEIILFEGCKSVLKAHTWGIKNTGALLTSHLNPRQLKLLIGLQIRVVFALDKDVDIREDKRIRELKRFVNVFYIEDADDLLDDKDSPVDKGEEVFIKLYENKRRFK